MARKQLLIQSTGIVLRTFNERRKHKHFRAGALQANTKEPVQASDRNRAGRNSETITQNVDTSKQHVGLSSSIFFPPTLLDVSVNSPKLQLFFHPHNLSVHFFLYPQSFPLLVTFLVASTFLCLFSIISFLFFFFLVVFH